MSAIDNPWIYSRDFVRALCSGGLRPWTAGRNRGGLLAPGLRSSRTEVTGFCEALTLPHRISDFFLNFRMQKGVTNEGPIARSRWSLAMGLYRIIVQLWV